MCKQQSQVARYFCAKRNLGTCQQCNVWLHNIFLWIQIILFHIFLLFEIRWQTALQMLKGHVLHIGGVEYPYLTYLFYCLCRLWQRSVACHGKNCLAWLICSQQWEEVWMRWLPWWRSSYMKNRTLRKRWDSPVTWFISLVWYISVWLGSCLAWKKIVTLM